MKKFEHLSPKELNLWEEHLQEKLQVKKRIPNNLLKSCWVEKYNTEGHVYDAKFNTRPDKTIRELEPPDEHRTYVEEITKFYEECS